MASQTELKKRLKVLMNKPENQVCSDCPERQPRWASLIVPPPGSPPGSLPIGAFCCLECSGSHRRLGVHISFVRSVNLDSWKEREVLAMENGGNRKVNAIFEARLSSMGSRKPSTGADGQTRERFIRDKYERRKFYDPSAMQAYEESSEEESSEEEVTAPARAKRTVRAPPSEVARRRVESRQARRAASSSSSGSIGKVPEKRKIKSPKSAAPAAPAASAPAVDLLDFSADFSQAPTAPAPAPVQQAPPPAAPTTSNAAAPAAALDLFANMSVSGAGETKENTSQQPETRKEEPARASNEQILAMFNTPTQQQNGFGMGMNGMMIPNSGMMMGAPGGMMPQQQGMNMNPAMLQQQQNMMMMQNKGMMMGGAGGMMPQQTNMMNNINPSMMQQQQQNMMMQPNGFGNPNMMMQNNMGVQNAQQMKPMMQQPQSGNNMRNGNMMPPQDPYGFPQQAMGSGPPVGTVPQGMANQQGGMKVSQMQQEPVKPDPFAEFSANAFRS